jgi:hypothetical protein
MIWSFPALLLVLAPACEPGVAIEDPFPEDSATPDTTDADADTDTDADTDSDSDSDTGGTLETGDTGEPLPTVDCSADLPNGYQPATVLNAKGYHGLAFIETGMLLGSDNNSLIEVDSDGQWGIFRPGMGSLEQIAVLPEGDLIISSRQTGDLIRMNMKGGTETIIANLGTYGVTLGPDGLIYGTSRNSVVRIDPDTGTMETLLPRVSQGATPRTIGFSPDNKRLYVTTIGNGTIFYVDMDEDLQVASEVKTFVTGVGGGWHDGLAVDICGNLYVPDYETGSLWRVTHDGVINKIFSPPQFNQYGHGVTWGTGQDGWNQMSLFLPQPYNSNTVIEIDIGMPPSTNWEGEALNAPY